MKYIMLLMLGITLAACGKRMALEPPAGADPAYPRSYPADNVAS